MEVIGIFRAAGTLLFALTLAQPAWAQDHTQKAGVQQDGSAQAQTQAQARPALLPSAAAHNVEAMTERYPKGAINSDQMAEQASVDAQSLRAALAAQLNNAKLACYERFFTNHCIDKAQEEYRTAIAALRPIELEAGAFQRQSRVDKRDKALEERRRQEEVEAPERMRLDQENEQKAAQRAQSRVQREAEYQAKQERDAQRDVNPNERVQRHEEKLKRLREDDARKEQERAGNIARYEQKQREAAERQQRVAERKAKKAAKQVQPEPTPSQQEPKPAEAATK